jgi:predicted nucleotidyltransferase
LNALGLIVEYNPFHNGHLFHIEAAKQTAMPDVVIVVMSGNFLQRGEPALINKWYRTEMALLGGVDIVVELPYRFATQKAETFAIGAVSILDALKCNSLCFGSEDGNITSFQLTRSLIETHQDQFQSKIKQYIKSGISYPSAIKHAFNDLAPSEEMINLTKPNNILGYHYIEAIDKLGSSMEAFTIKRKNAEYHDEHFTSETIASATSIRKALFSKEAPNMIDRFVPISTRDLLIKYLDNFQEFHQWENYWPLLRYRILHATNTELKEIYEVEEGLENRFKHAASHSKSFQQFMQNVKTKRYTWTRLQRACLHILTNTKKADILTQTETPSYIRLLGMTDKGQTYINQHKKSLPLPLVSKVSAFQGNGALDLEFDLKAAQLYALGLSEPFKTKLLDLDFRQPPIILKK